MSRVCSAKASASAAVTMSYTHPEMEAMRPKIEAMFDPKLIQ